MSLHQSGQRHKHENHRKEREREKGGDGKGYEAGMEEETWGGKGHTLHCVGITAGLGSINAAFVTA